MHVKSSDTIDREQISPGKDTTKQVLIGADEAPNFAMRRFEIQPGGGMPLHTNRVETLISKFQTAGSYDYTWQPQNLSTGVYVIRLQSGNQTNLRKVVFVK